MKLVYRAGLWLGLFLSITGCSNRATEKSYSAYFVQTLNQLALPTEKYITENADRIVHTNDTVAIRIFERFESLSIHRQQPISSFESSMALIRNSDGRVLLFGSESSCDSYVTDSNGRELCNDELRELLEEKIFNF